MRGLSAEDFVLLGNDLRVTLQVASEVAGAPFEGLDFRLSLVVSADPFAVICDCAHRLLSHRTRAVASALAFGALWQDQTPVFRSRLDVVPLHVAATDVDGRAALDLQAVDFTVYEDGRAVPIAAFTRPPQGIVVTILIAELTRSFVGI